LQNLELNALVNDLMPIQATCLSTLIEDNNVTNVDAVYGPKAFAPIQLAESSRLPEQQQARSVEYLNDSEDEFPTTQETVPQAAPDTTVAPRPLSDVVIVKPSRYRSWTHSRLLI
jgi:hypothetical protein